MAIVLLAVAALVPLAFAPGLLLFYDVTPKVVLLLAGTAIAAVWCAIAPVKATREVRLLGALFAVQVVWMGISTGFSERPELSVIGTNWRRFGLVTQMGLAAFAYLAAAAMASCPTVREWMMRAVAGTATVAALYGIAQYFGLDPWIDPARYRVGEGVWMIVRPPSFMGHANYAAVVYLGGVFAGAAAGRWWTWTAVPVCGAAVVLGGSRAALLGLAAGAVVWVFTQKWRPRGRQLAVVAGVTVAAVVFYFAPPGERVRARVRWSVEDARGGARLMLWKGTLGLAAERPLTGWGPETFTAVFVKRQPAELSAAFPDFYYESPHNVFLDTLAGQGVPGVALLLAVCGVAVFFARGAVLAGLVGILVAVQFNALTVGTAVVLFTFIAAAVGARSGTSLRRGYGWQASARATFVAVVVVCSCVAVWLAAWDVRLKNVDRAVAAGGAAQEEWLGAERVRPYGASADLWYSRRLLQQGRGALQAAIGAGERATRTSEEPHNAWYHLSTLHALSGDATETERCLRMAIDAAPTWFKPRWTLARLLLLSGRGAEAQRQAKLAVALDGGKHPEVAQTLAEARGRTQK